LQVTIKQEKKDNKAADKQKGFKAGLRSQDRELRNGKKIIVIED